jgi:hypothetical protein
MSEIKAEDQPSKDQLEAEFDANDKGKLLRLYELLLEWFVCFYGYVPNLSDLI